jgi:hypothetical protein
MLWKCHRISPQHMVVFLSLEIVLLSQGMKNPRFSNRGFTLLYVVLVCLREHEQENRCLQGFSSLVRA